MAGRPGGVRRAPQRRLRRSHPASHRTQPRRVGPRQRRQHGRLRNTRRSAPASRHGLHDRARPVLRRFRHPIGNQHARPRTRCSGNRTAAGGHCDARLGGTLMARKPTLFSLPRLTLFYLPLIVLASVAVGMVIASRLDLSPASSAQTIAVPPMNSAPLTGPLSADTFRNIAKAQAPMVVNIRTEMKAKAQDLEGLFGGGDDFFRRFFGGPGGGQGQGQGQGQGDDDSQQGRGRRRNREPIARADGTGFIISKDGFILTNNHVVEDAIKIEVSLYLDDENTYSAKVIGRDALTDSALIQLVEHPKSPLPE